MLENNWQFFKKLNTDLPYELAIPFPGIKEKIKTCIYAKTPMQMLKVAPFIMAKSGNNPGTPGENIDLLQMGMRKFLWMIKIFLEWIVEIL